MSLQDDYWDVLEHVKGTNHERALKRIWHEFVQLENFQQKVLPVLTEIERGHVAENEIKSGRWKEWIK